MGVRLAQKIGMQRMQGPIGIDRQLRRLARLPQHLAAVDPLDDGVPDGTPEQVFFKLFECESREKIVE